MRHETTAVDRLPAAVFADAATAAGRTPSILNTQSWLWRLHADRLDLFANRSRQLAAGDPQGRQPLVSCGAALHLARIALSAEGWAAHVAWLPKASDPVLLATVVVNGRSQVTMEAMRLAHAMRIRHRPATGQRAANARRSVAGHRGRGPRGCQPAGAHLRRCGGPGSAASRAAAVEAGDAQIAAELTYWTGRAKMSGTWPPASVLPDHPTQTTAPSHDFGRPGTLLVGAGHGCATTWRLCRSRAPPGGVVPWYGCASLRQLRPGISAGPYQRLGVRVAVDRSGLGAR